MCSVTARSWSARGRALIGLFRAAQTEPGRGRGGASQGGLEPRAPANVRVVALRRAATLADGSGQPSPVGWQREWVVRMHKVNQWYPSLGQHRVRFRGPYLKGPAGKPLLGGDIVKGLVR